MMRKMKTRKKSVGIGVVQHLVHPLQRVCLWNPEAQRWGGVWEEWETRNRSL